MKTIKLCALALAVTAAATFAPTAEARKGKNNPGNELGPPTLVSASVVIGECDGDELTIDDTCVEVVFTKVCDAVKYPVEVTKGFDITDDEDTCDNYFISEDTAVPAEACTGTNNCLFVTDAFTAECQTALVPLGTVQYCPDGCFDYDTLCVKVKATDPPQKGPKSISESTEFSNSICSADDCEM